MDIKRDYYLKKIINKQSNGRIKIITGIKGSGKSYLLFRLYKKYLLENNVKEDEIITLKLDDIEEIKYRNPFTLYEYIKEKTSDINKKYYVLIDEIQFVESKNNPYDEDSKIKITFIDVLLGLMKKENLDIYVTGSNSKMLSSDILTEFRDRGDEIHLNPLVISEIIDHFENYDKAFEFYSLYGGMPYVYQIDNEVERSKYLKNLFKETYLKDIIERNKITSNKEVLDILLDFISSSIGSLTNPSKLSRRLKSERNISISSETIEKYLSYFEDSFLINKAYRYDVKGGRYFKTPLKYYFTDIGLRNARLNFRQVEINHIMENIIYNELIFRGYNVDVGVVEAEKIIDDKRKKVQLEIDFIINKGNKKLYIQSALNVDDKEKKEQEIASLKKTNDFFKRIVVVKDNIIARYDEYGIYFVGLKEFLLNKEILN